MKKIISITLTIILLILVATSVSYAAGYTYVTASAIVDNATGVVTISGNISSGPGQQVTVLVVNPSGGTDYVDQTISGANGSYQFTYKLDENIGGVYTVTVGGTGVDTPVSTTFTYKPGEDSSDNEAPVWPRGSNLKATNISQTSLTLTWTKAQDNVGISNYKIYKDDEVLVTLPGLVTSYRVTGLNPGKTYTFKVEAGDAAGNWSTDGPSLTVTTRESGKDDVYIDVSIFVDNAKGVVTISGNISSGPGQQVTVLVINPSGGTDYIDQTISGANGSYQFTYKLDESTGGVYTVIVGGTGISTPVSTTFTYKPGKEEPGEPGGYVPIFIPGGEPGNVKVNKPVLSRETGEAKTYVTEYAISQAFSEVVPDDSGVKNVTLNIPAIADANAYVLEIPAKVLTSGKSNEVIKVITEIATITLPTNMLANSEEENIELVISKADISGLSEDVKANIGDRPVIEIYFRRVDGTPIPWNDPYMPVYVSVPYSSQENEDSEKITVWYIEENNSIVPVYSGRYNPSTQMVTFTTTHLSKFAVAYVDVTFDDISNYGWAKREIEVLASKGIIKGISTTRKIFNPSANITRADFAALLVRTLGLTAEVNSNFDDVTIEDYFYKEVGIAKELGITNGVGNNKFAPREEITRQDMMTMTARALKLLNKLEAEGTKADLDKFSDADEIASYAVESIAALVKDGLIVGSNNMLNPKDNAIRAEVAVLMYRIYNK